MSLTISATARRRSFGLITSEWTRVKLAEHVSDFIQSDNGGRKRMLSSKKGIREPDMEEDGVAMLGRYTGPLSRSQSCAIK